MKLKTSKIFGTLTFVLGAVVMIGWFIKNQALIQIYGGFVPMQFNTALCFTLVGLSILFHRTRFALYHLLSVPAGAIGLITLLEYALHTNIWGIDQFFMDDYIMDETSYAGRMAPNTALCFSFIGASVGCFESPLFRKIVAGCLLAISSVALVGYFSQVEWLYKWGDYTGMALHTAGGMALVAVGMFFMNGFRRHKLFDNAPLQTSYRRRESDVYVP